MMKINTVPVDPWIVAQERYVQGLNDAEKGIFREATLENMFYSARAVQKTPAEDSKLHLVSQKLTPLRDAISQYAIALDPFSDTSSIILCLLLGSIRVVLHVANEFEKYYQRLVGLLERIGALLPRFNVYSHLFPSRERLTYVLGNAYLEIIVVCTSVKEVFRPHLDRNSRKGSRNCKVAWRSFESQLETITEKFREHKRNVEAEAGLDRIDGPLNNIQDHKENQQVLQARDIDEEREKQVSRRILLLKLLSKFDHESKHRRISKIRYPGTGFWIIDTPVWKKWVEEPTSSGIWCHGMPGCGKSFLTSRIVDYLKTKAGPTSKIVYFYCDFTECISLQATEILGSLVRQLLLDEESIPYEVAECIDVASHRCSRSILCTTTLVQILNKTIKALGLRQVYVVIDGLDECTDIDREDTLQAIEGILKFNSITIKTWVSCRTDVKPNRIFGTQNFEQLLLSQQITSPDVSVFVRGTVNEKIEKRKLIVHDPALIPVITTTLIDRANGLFLSAHIQLEDICERLSDSEKRQALKDLPLTLSETYERVATKIFDSGNLTMLQMAEKTLKWLVCARRPLSIEELKGAVTFEPDNRKWKEAGIPASDIDYDITHMFSTLVTFDADDESVRLSHFTVQEFLLSKSSPAIAPPVAWIRFDRGEANMEVVGTCMSYLQFCDFQMQVEADAKIEPVKPVVSQADLKTGMGLPISGFWLYGHRRRTPLSPRIADYRKQLGDLFHNPPSEKYLREYRLLQYTCESWLAHTSELAEVNTLIWPTFKSLVFEQQLPFEFRPRPWELNCTTAVLSSLLLFRWAVLNHHRPVLTLLKCPPRGPDLSFYLQHDADLPKEESVCIMLLNDGHRIEDKFMIFLLENGAFNSTSTSHGEDVLEWAVNEGRLTLVNCMLEYRKVPPNRTILNYEENWDNEITLEVVKYLRGNHDQDVAEKLDRVLSSLCERQDKFISDQNILLFFDKGAKGGSVGHNGYDIVVWAIMEERWSLLASLASHGVETFYVDEQGRTALHYAIEKDENKILDYVLRLSTQTMIDDFLEGLILENLANRRKLSDSLVMTIVEHYAHRGGSKMIKSNVDLIEWAFRQSRWEFLRWFAVQDFSAPARYNSLRLLVAKIDTCDDICYFKLALRIGTDSEVEKVFIDAFSAEDLRVASFLYQHFPKKVDLESLKTGRFYRYSIWKTVFTAANDGKYANYNFIKQATTKLLDSITSKVLFEAITEALAVQDMILVEHLYKHAKNRNIAVKDDDPLQHLQLGTLDTPLHLCVRSRSYELCEKLISLGVTVNSPNVHGVRPLHEAARMKNSRLIQLLIHHQAQVNAADIYGNTPLHSLTFAFKNRMDQYCEYEELADLLMAHGADPYATNLHREKAVIMQL